MLWIILKSYRSNLRRYIFAIIALAMATVVSSLGLSGVNLMANMWRYPFVHWSGGHIMLKQTRGSLFEAYGLVSYSRVHEVIAEIYPEAEITSTLHVPGIVWLPTDGKDFLHPVVGRRGGLDTWYFNAPPLKGEPLSQDNLGEDVFVMRGFHLERVPGPIPIPTRAATYRLQGGQEIWDLVGAEELELSLVGTTGHPSVPGLWGHLDVVQRLSGTPSDRVHVIGIGLQGLQATVDDRVDLLRERLTVAIPELSVITVDEYGDLIADDLVTLRDAAAKYSPVLLVIALQVVVATALAVVHSRRRELSLLRTIGFSYRKIWLLFTFECSLSALLSCGLGLAAAKFAAYMLFQSGSVSLVPFALALAASLIVSMIIGRRAVASSVPSVLRNS